jgi:outer membrane protein TolC
MKEATSIVFFTFIFSVGFSQNKLESYIKIGLEKNESIHQQTIQLEKATYALKEAKSLFYPNVSFNSTYTIAGGGRTIDFPAGDLLNNVYNSLNQLTNSSAFPQLQNQSILLNPNNFLDANIRTSISLLNAELIYNKRIKNQLIDLQYIEREIYKRELVKDLQLAYYNFLQANEAITIVENALTLVKESNRVNNSLFNNDRINKTALSRSENEVIKIKAQLETAKINKLNAQYYFNFLLNRDLIETIEIENFDELPLNSISNSIDKREELLKLNQIKTINDNTIKLSKAYLFPKINGFMDIGAQAFDFDFDKDARYYLGGLSLQWNIFSGNKNKFKVKQAELENELISSQIQNIEQQLQLQLQIAENKLQSKITDYKASLSQVKVNQKYYNDIMKMYKEGSALYIELLDAQNQLLNTQLQSNINRYEAWMAFVEIERANASFNLKQ